MKLRGLAVDNGGSEVRVTDLEGHHTLLGNDFVTIKREDFRVKENDSPLDVIDVRKAPNEEYLGLVARGIVGRMYNGCALTIDNQSSKTSSVNFYRQFIFAVARQCMQFKMGEPDFGTHTGHRRGEVDYLVPLATCIPVKEHSGKQDCAKRLKAAVSGDYVVSFPLLDCEDRTVSFRLMEKHIGVVPEGGVAIAAMSKDLTQDDFTLIVDMGKLTVDIQLFRGKTLYGNKVISSPYAGGTLLALIRSALADEGYALTEEQVETVLSTGVVRTGASTVDVTDIIKAQKRVYVQNYLKNEVIQLLNMNAVNAKQITYLLPIGAGMNNPMSPDSIICELARACGLGGAAIKVLSSDLRYVNLEQTAMFAKVMLLKAKAEVNAPIVE